MVAALLGNKLSPLWGDSILTDARDADCHVALRAPRNDTNLVADSTKIGAETIENLCYCDEVAHTGVVTEGNACGAIRSPQCDSIASAAGR